MKAFIDCGAHRGASVKAFRRHWPDAEDYVIYCFEPNPYLIPALRKLNGHIYVFTAAVWSSDGIKPFYLSSDRDEYEVGSTLIRDKTTGNIDKERPVYVSCVDIGAWIRLQFRRTDYVILKMDIEGAEYEVISSMYYNGTLGYVNELYGEMHGDRVNMTAEDDAGAEKKLRQYGLEMKPWHIDEKDLA